MLVFYLDVNFWAQWINFTKKKNHIQEIATYPSVCKSQSTLQNSFTEFTEELCCPFDLFSCQISLIAFLTVLIVNNFINPYQACYLDLYHAVGFIC